MVSDVPTISKYTDSTHKTTLQRRHSERHGVSNHQRFDCLANHLFSPILKKTSKLCVTGLCEGNPPVTVDSPHRGPVTRKMFPLDDVIMKEYGNILTFVFAAPSRVPTPAAVTLDPVYGARPSHSARASSSATLVGSCLSPQRYCRNGWFLVRSSRCWHSWCCQPENNIGVVLKIIKIANKEWAQFWAFIHKDSVLLV